MKSPQIDETVPADIATAIDELVHCAEVAMSQAGDAGREEARTVLNALILLHLKERSAARDPIAGLSILPRRSNPLKELSVARRLSP
jgi:hypothetical protein